MENPDDQVIDSNANEASEKSYTTAVILSAIFGVIGIHHFYLERWGMGIFDLGLSVTAYVLYLNGEWVWAISLFAIDFIHTAIVTFQLLVGTFKDGSGKIVTYPGQKLR